MHLYLHASISLNPQFASSAPDLHASPSIYLQRDFRAPAIGFVIEKGPARAKALCLCDSLFTCLQRSSRPAELHASTSLHLHRPSSAPNLHIHPSMRLRRASGVPPELQPSIPSRPHAPSEFPARLQHFRALHLHTSAPVTVTINSKL